MVSGDHGQIKGLYSSIHCTPLGLGELENPLIFKEWEPPKEDTMAIVTPTLINSLVLLAIARRKYEIYSHVDHLDTVKQFFDTDPVFMIDWIATEGGQATVAFKFRPQEEKP